MHWTEYNNNEPLSHVYMYFFCIDVKFILFDFLNVVQNVKMIHGQWQKTQLYRRRLDWQLIQAKEEL